MELNGAVAVLTGTSSGLGRQLAVDLADAGALVVGLARRAELQQELNDELGRRSPGSRAEAFDVSDPGGFVAKLAAIEEAHGRIDLLVNNAAAFEQPGPTTYEGVELILRTNFLASMAGTLAVLPGMRRRGRGAIVNVSSDVARAPIPHEPAYCASKAALSAFTESLAFDAAGNGVALHVLYPAYIPRGEAAGKPPSLGQRLVVRTDAQVSRRVIEAVRRGRPDIDAAWLPRMALVLRAFSPGAYRRLAPRANP